MVSRAIWHIFLIFYDVKTKSTSYFAQNYWEKTDVKVVFYVCIVSNNDTFTNLFGTNTS